MTPRNERSTAVVSSSDPFCMAWHGVDGIFLDRRYKRTSTFGGTVGCNGPFGPSSSPGSLDRPAPPAAEPLGSLHMNLSDGKDGARVLAVPPQSRCRPDPFVLLGLAGRQKYRTGPREVQPAHAHSRPSARNRGRVGLAAGCYRRSASPKVHHIEGLTLCLCLPLLTADLLRSGLV